MSEIAPPQPTGAPPPTAPPPTAVATNPPPRLLDLPLGARLEATIIGPPDKGLIQVATEHGTVQLRSLVALPEKATLQLVLQSRAPSLIFLIAGIDGRPLSVGTPAGPLATSLAGPQGAATGGGTGGIVQPATPSATPTPVTLTTGAQLTGILIRPAAIAPGAPTTGQVPPAGTLAGSVGAAATAGGNSPALTPGTTIPGTSGATTPATGTPSPAVTPVSSTAAGTVMPHSLAVGTQLPLRVVSVLPPGQAATIVTPDASAAARPVAGQSLHGVVIPSHGGNQAVVQTSLGTVSLATPTALPAGTSLVLEFTGAPRPPAAVSHPGTHGASQQAIDQAGRAALTWAREWPALDETLRVLADIAPGAHQHVTSSALPRPDAQLTSNVLFFLSALRGGDVRSWIGDGPARILQRLRADVANRLGDDFAQMSRTADEPASGDWRMTAVPFLAEDEIQKIRLLTRHHEENDEDEENDGESSGMRFVVDLDLTQLGRMQLDGLVADGGKHVDLVVRTDNPLPPQMQSDIRDIFIDAAAVTGISGGVGFQAQPAGFVDAMPAATSSGLGLEV